MKAHSNSNHDDQVAIEIKLSQQAVNDLKRVAAFYESTVDEMIHQYIDEGIANDSRKGKRVEFEQNLCNNIPHKECKEDIAEEIKRDSSLLY